MRIGQPIALFFLASGGVHAAALALSQLHSPSTPAPGQVASSLQVRLNTSNASRPSRSRPAAEKARQRNRPASGQHNNRQATPTPRRLLTALSTNHKIQPRTTTESHSRHAETDHHSTQQQVRTPRLRPGTVNPTVQTATIMAQRRNHIRGRLQQELATFFRYPYMARRRGWYGRVVLGVSIMPSGQISRVAVQQSSGHSVLDEAALTAIHHIRKLDWAPAVLQGDAIEIQLPVIYRLLGG